MQASIRRGELKRYIENVVLDRHLADLCRTPVWTAFITHHVASPAWIRKDSYSPKTVYLAELQLYIFTDEYTPQLGPDGAHELKFKTTECRFCTVALLACLLVSRCP